MQATIDNVKDTRKIITDLDIPAILNSGSLLGAYRDGGVIEGDEDDVDFAVPYKIAEFNMAEIILAFLDKNFRLKRARPTVLSFERNSSHIDFLFYKKDGGYYYETLYHQKKPFALLVPCEFWDELAEIEFLGERFLCPKDIEGFLEWRYGDWRTPIPRSQFSFKNLLDKEHLTKWI